MTPARREALRFLLVSYRSMPTRHSVVFDGFVVHSDGRVERPGATAPSNTWSITGAVRYNNFGHCVERWTLAQLFDPETFRAIGWHHANGKQRVFLTDLDHGTRRMQVSPGYDVSTCDLEHVERMRFNASQRAQGDRYRSKLWYSNVRV